MVNIIDRRHKALGGQSYGRSESSITGIAWHYTAVARESRAFITGHENYWRNNRGWRRGGYHYYIDADGKIYQNYDLTTISNGVKGHNSKVVNISVEANSASNYSKAQEDARRDLTKYLMKRLGLSANAVKQHKEFSGQSTSCAGYTRAQMDKFRQELSGGKVPTVTPSKPNQSVTSVAREVIAGKWGNGSDRVQRLRNAGYNPNTVQSEVDRLVNGNAPKPTLKSTDTIAKEVIAGKWGNGSDRVNRLRRAGYNPSTVQTTVNRLAGGYSEPKPALKSPSVIAKEVIAGKWGNGNDRINRLKKAGYNPSAVQAEVNRLAGGGGSSRKSASAVANDIIAGRGNWGTGKARRDKLRRAGYNPSEVQNIINKRL